MSRNSFRNNGGLRRAQNKSFMPVAVKSKQGNFYHGGLYVNTGFVPGVFATGSSREDCLSRVVLKWSRMQSEKKEAAEAAEKANAK